MTKEHERILSGNFEDCRRYLARTNHHPPLLPKKQLLPHRCRPCQAHNFSGELS
jgi:hypothetical protein